MIEFRLDLRGPLELDLDVPATIVERAPQRVELFPSDVPVGDLRFGVPERYYSHMGRAIPEARSL